MAAHYGETYNEMCSCYEFVNNRAGRHLMSVFKLCSSPVRVNPFFSALLLEWYLPTEQLTTLESKLFHETYQALLWRKKDWGRRGG